MVLHVFIFLLGGVPLCIPYGLYSGTSLGGTTRGTLEGYPGRVLSQQPRNQAAQIGKTIKKAIKLIKPFLSSHVDITPDPRSDTALAYARLVKGWGGN